MAKSTKTNWRQKYELQWTRFQKAVETATERGYTIPPEITGIKKAKGGYKQAFGRIKQLTLTQIQRESKAYLLKQERKQIDYELQQLYRDTVEGITGEVPTSIPKYTVGTDASYVMADVQNYVDNYQKAQDIMSWEDTADTILYNVKDTVRNFQNPYLAYKVIEELKQAESRDREGLVERLTNASNDVLTELQRASTYMYTGEIDENGYDDSSLFYGWWTEFLTGTYDSDYVEEYEEY